MTMASKQGHESLESYTDNVNVKISERYKPPPRINLAMTYAQRLTLNKQIQDNMPNYEFLLEKTVLEKMKEWRSVRNSVADERKAKLEKIIEETKKKEQAEHENFDELEVKTVDETVISNYNSTSAFATANINQTFLNYTTSNSILMPTQAPTNYSNILTPIPLKNSTNEQYNFKPVDKSPFNFADFENNTSSPFDNMELKSINDMEELAQVLKSEETKYKANIPVYQPYQSTPSNPQLNFPTYLGNTCNIPSSVSYVQPVNGYYFSPDAVHRESIHVPYSTADYSSTSLQGNPLVETKKSNCKSVPDIINSLKAELENSHIDNTKVLEYYIRDNVIPQSSRPKSTEAIIYPSSNATDEDLDNPFNRLSKNQQDLCRSISSMGFPLSRVARTCKLLGDDHKKIVEHLLALSDLLDLGFAERDVSSALLQCDNDRDKALDKLIS